MGTKTEKPLVFFRKTENQMLKNEKSANRNDHQNRKTEVFCNKNRKTDLKNSQNRKTENPNAPLQLAVRTSDHKILHGIIARQTVENMPMLKRLSCILHEFAKGYQGYKSNFGFHFPSDLEIRQI